MANKKDPNNKDKKKLLLELLDSEKKEQIVDLVLNDLNDETVAKIIELSM